MQEFPVNNVNHVFQFHIFMFTVQEFQFLDSLQMLINQFYRSFFVHGPTVHLTAVFIIMQHHQQ
jgi:hypothetical protein